jgi:iron complex transport system ATP-binding protein
VSLSANELCFSRGSKEVVTDLSFELRPGEVLGVVGPNGAGKSTVIKLLTGVLEPSAGEVLLDNVRVRRMSRLELARRIAVVPQAGELPLTFRAFDLVMMGRTPHLGFLAPETKRDHAIVERAMRRVDVWAFRERCLGELSGGERQRVLLARALAQEPRYLLLDEPTNHLDLKYQVEVLRFVRREASGGLGALVVLHDLNLSARVCDRLLVMDQGRCVAEGSPAEVLTEARLREVYRAEVEVLEHPSTREPVVLPRL